ncbi:MAG: hypothetical protein K8R86_01200, partial [Bacteroidales bacterium]|nr:hypothetical protein [Bacteroidales bacterium]
IETANEIYNRMIDIFAEQLDYYFAFTGNRKNLYNYEREQNLAMLQKLVQVSTRFKQDDIANRALEVFDIYFAMYSE